MIYLQYIVKGRVQGVGFRNGVYKFVLKNLQNAIGYVTNQPDGTVLIKIGIDDSKIPIFEEYLKRGPLLAKVESLDRIALAQDDVENRLFYILR